MEWVDGIPHEPEIPKAYKFYILVTKMRMPIDSDLSPEQIDYYYNLYLSFKAIDSYLEPNQLLGQ